MIIVPIGVSLDLTSRSGYIRASPSVLIEIGGGLADAQGLAECVIVLTARKHWDRKSAHNCRCNFGWGYRVPTEVSQISSSRSAACVFVPIRLGAAAR